MAGERAQTMSTGAVRQADILEANMNNIRLACHYVSAHTHTLGRSTNTIVHIIGIHIIHARTRGLVAFCKTYVKM